MVVDQSSVSDFSRPQTGLEIRRAFLKFFEERGHKILASSSLIPEDPTVLLTIAGMLPFKPVFLGQKKRPAARVTSSQKCIRTNDIENVGKTARHQTFFEMLGNFSFGDYFKQEAIEWAWELSTRIFKLDPKNLVISVFKEDLETEKIWQSIPGIDPKRIIRMGEADNFWASGVTGPCGPCSEIYYDFQPHLGNENINLENDERFIEFYNLVFMEYSRDSNGKLSSLSQKNIDTGMGLERMAQILQNKDNNYETDLIYPIILKASSLANITYQEATDSIKTSLKIIGDHTRAITFLLADGVRASNLGRGYVARRLIRRVVRHGKLIGIKKCFLANLAESVIELMGSCYPEIVERKKIIYSELEREEKRFLETLERGEKILSEILSENPNEISGAQAFELYDTYGFPLELTKEIAQENGLTVDTDGFHNSMKKQRQRAQSATTNIDLTVRDSLNELTRSLSTTKFEGYEKTTGDYKVTGLIVNGDMQTSGVEGDTIQIILNGTTFYAEGGGQVGDCGIITNNSKTKLDNLLIEIQEVKKKQNIFIHYGKILKGKITIGDKIHAAVNQQSRQRAQANHTATHLLQAALKTIVEPDISQAGSLVDFNHLRFDFNSTQPINSAQINKIEDLINNWISEAHTLNISHMELKEAKKVGAIAMFGEKYDEEVRVVNIPNISMELCGGTHVNNTCELGMFKIINESGISAGVRRIEAVSGPSVLQVLKERDSVVKQLTSALKAQPKDIVDRVLTLNNDLKETNKLLESSREALAIEKAKNLATEAKVCGTKKILVKRIDGMSGGSLQKTAETLISQIGTNAAIVLGGLPIPNDQNKVILVAAFGEDLVTQGMKAGKFISEIAKLCGGGGGGRANLAQAGGKHGHELNNALDIATNKLKKN